MGNKDLTVKTKHEHPIYFAIHYKYTNGVWYTTGWWSVTNTSQSRPNIETNNATLYFHAYCSKCDTEWGNSNHQFLCKKYGAFDSTNNPSDRENYEYRDFNEVSFNSSADNYTYTFN